MIITNQLCDWYKILVLNVLWSLYSNVTYKVINLTEWIQYAEFELTLRVKILKMAG